MRPRYWRVWRDMPAKGRISLMAGGIMRLLHENLAGELSDEEYDRAVDHLEELQEALVADGMLIIKIFLHTPEKVQRKRMKKAEGDRDEGWRIDQRDWAMLDLLEESGAKLEKLLRNTSVAGAPWSVIEATNARYRDVAVGRTIVNAITARLAEKPPAGPAVSDELFSPGRTTGHGPGHRGPHPHHGSRRPTTRSSTGSSASCTGCRCRPGTAACRPCWPSRGGTPPARAGRSGGSPRRSRPATTA